MLVGRKYAEPHRNKADLRRTLGLLVDDAKANPVDDKRDWRRPGRDSPFMSQPKRVGGRGRTGAFSY